MNLFQLTYSYSRARAHIICDFPIFNSILNCTLCKDECHRVKGRRKKNTLTLHIRKHGGKNEVWKWLKTVKLVGRICNFCASYLPIAVHMKQITFNHSLIHPQLFWYREGEREITEKKIRNNNNNNGCVFGQHKYFSTDETNQIKTMARLLFTTCQNNTLFTLFDSNIENENQRMAKKNTIKRCELRNWMNVSQKML